MSDRNLISLSAGFRALATGMLGITLGIYLARLNLTPTQIGFVVGLGLGGCAVGALLATLFSDRFGRRRFLIALALLSALGGVVTAIGSGFALLAAAAFFGMLNGMGRDRGAGLIVEQAILPSTVPTADRTKAFAWYNVLQDAGHALGSLLAGLPFILKKIFVIGEVEALRGTVLFYSVLILIPILFYSRLSSKVEIPLEKKKVVLSPESRLVLTKISSLFLLDSLGGGFLTTALLSFFFFKRFGVGPEIIGLLFFGARVANAISHLGAAWLAKKIGLVNTMVFTHIPSSLLLMTVGFVPSFPIAAALFLLREGLVEMDVPTRQSYVMAMVKEEERSIASGVTHLVRLGAWAVAPSFAGMMMQGIASAMPLYAGGGMKILYDILLYKNFKKLKAPEES